MNWPKIPPRKLKRQLKQIASLKDRLIDFGFQYRHFTDIAPSREAVAERDPFEATARIDEVIFRPARRGEEDFLTQFENYSSEYRSADKKLLDVWRARRPFPTMLRFEERRGLMVRATNLVDDLEYAVASQQVGTLRAYDIPCYVVTDIAPTPDGYFVLTGPQREVSLDKETLAYGWAAILIQREPGLQLRNPDLRAQAEAAVAQDAATWREVFGASYITGRPEEVAEDLKRFGRALDDRDLTDAEREARGDVDDAASRFSLEMLDEYAPSTHIGVIHTADVGVISGPLVPAFLDLVLDPTSVERDDTREELRFHFFEQARTPYHLLALGADHPDAFTRVVRALIDAPDFEWTSDGEDLLRQHYPDFDQDRFPRYAILSDKMQQAYAEAQERGLFGE